MTLFVGTSGWQYAAWRGRYYPAKLPTSRWFEHLLGDFRTVELNASFYRLPTAAAFAGWRTRSPDDAVIAVKVSRYLTHVRRLRDPREPVSRLIDHAASLGPKLGPVLVQLPPDLPAVADALDATLSCFPQGVRVAVEPRHASWFADDVRAVLERRGAALCWADRHGDALTPLWRTGDWGYLRMHEGAANVWPFYDRATLAAWVERIAELFSDSSDVFVYFNNDPGCAAVDNAITFAEEARRRGHTVTRVPDRRPATDSADA